MGLKNMKRTCQRVFYNTPPRHKENHNKYRESQNICTTYTCKVHTPHNSAKTTFWDTLYSYAFCPATPPMKQRWNMQTAFQLIPSSWITLRFHWQPIHQTREAMTNQTGRQFLLLPSSVYRIIEHEQRCVAIATTENIVIDKEVKSPFCTTVSWTQNLLRRVFYAPSVNSRVQNVDLWTLSSVCLFCA